MGEKIEVDIVKQLDSYIITFSNSGTTYMVELLQDAITEITNLRQEIDQIYMDAAGEDI